jgi:hypothetical protein
MINPQFADAITHGSDIARIAVRQSKETRDHFRFGLGIAQIHDPL